jgi:formyltetrahydrofolate deformylase
VTPASTPTARLLIACPDARGIVATVAGFVAEHGGNLLESEQHTDTEHGEFFMRVEFELAGCDLNRDTFREVWGPVAAHHGMDWRVYWSDDVKRVGILVSRAAHCLHDLIWRWEAGELNVEIAAVISNHDVLRRPSEHAGIPFHHCPIEPDRKTLQEQQVRAILDDARCDFVVLARYMQILSPEFLVGYEQRVINIHHSFLPAFAGGDPYRQAYDRGVKIIGATSHYVTEELDAGPIISQEVVDVSHRHTVADLRRKGRDLERIVLARAVRAHVEDRILASKGKTVVFS